MMNLFTILLLGHLIADFPFQTPTILRWKFRGGLWILPHIAIHTAVMVLLIENPAQHWLMIATIITSHFAIDWFKVTKWCVVSDGLSFLLDQSAHIGILWIVTQAAGMTSHQYTFEYLPLIMWLAIMSAVFMYLNVIKSELKAMPVPAVFSRYAFHISKATGWMAVISLMISIQSIH